MSLEAGQFGVDTTVNTPRTITWLGDDTLMMTGHLAGSSLAETKAMRDELGGLIGQTVPIQITDDSAFDGFYLISYAAAQPGAGPASNQGNGLWTYRIDGRRRGQSGRVRWESNIIGTVLNNDHGVTEAESAPFIGCPVGAYAIDFGSSPPSTITRTAQDGAVTVYRDVPYTTTPSWGVSMANWRKGAARIEAGGYRRTGVVIPDTPTNWLIGNSLIKVEGSASDGRFTVSSWDTGLADWSGEDFNIDISGDLGTWDSITALYNTPERAAVRLQNDATGGWVTCDIEVRRGSRFASFYLTRHATATLKVEHVGVEAAAAITPTGASSAVAIQGNTSHDGNRWVLGSAKSHTQDTTNGAISKTSVAVLDFFIGWEYDGASAASGDTAADLCLQYLGGVSETVQAVLR